MWQLTMYCHWRPPDAMSLLTENILGASDYRDLISMVTFTFVMLCHLIRLASAPLTCSRLATFGWVQFPCAMRGTMQNLRRVGKNYDPILSRLWNKVHEIFRRCRKPLILSNTLFGLSVSCFIQKIYAIKSWLLKSSKNWTNAKKFLAPNFCERNSSDFSMAVC